jgi:hypothetical protein
MLFCFQNRLFSSYLPNVLLQLANEKWDSKQTKKLLRQILLIGFCCAESSADEGSEPPRKRLHSEFTLDGTGNIMNAQYNQKNLIHYGL